MKTYKSCEQNNLKIPQIEANQTTFFDILLKIVQNFREIEYLTDYNTIFFKSMQIS